eukprot:m.39866 g.39866  ORF g.39866 m.39866 type:complete len:847 (+) comp10365_c0_seq2:55-2595(+)
MELWDRAKHVERQFQHWFGAPTLASSSPPLYKTTFIVYGGGNGHAPVQFSTRDRMQPRTTLLATIEQTVFPLTLLEYNVETCGAQRTTVSCKEELSTVIVNLVEQTQRIQSLPFNTTERCNRVMVAAKCCEALEGLFQQAAALEQSVSGSYSGAQQQQQQVYAYQQLVQPFPQPFQQQAQPQFLPQAAPFSEHQRFARSTVGVPPMTQTQSSMVQAPGQNIMLEHDLWTVNSILSKWAHVPFYQGVMLPAGDVGSGNVGGGGEQETRACASGQGVSEEEVDGMNGTIHTVAFEELTKSELLEVVTSLFNACTALCDADTQSQPQAATVPLALDLAHLPAIQLNHTVQETTFTRTLFDATPLATSIADVQCEYLPQLQGAIAVLATYSGEQAHKHLICVAKVLKEIKRALSAVIDGAHVSIMSVASSIDTPFSIETALSKVPATHQSVGTGIVGVRSEVGSRSADEGRDVAGSQGTEVAAAYVHCHIQSLRSLCQSFGHVEQTSLLTVAAISVSPSGVLSVIEAAPLEHVTPLSLTPGDPSSALTRVLPSNALSGLEDVNPWLDKADSVVRLLKDDDTQVRSSALTSLPELNRLLSKLREWMLCHWKQAISELEKENLLRAVNRLNRILKSTPAISSHTPWLCESGGSLVRDTGGLEHITSAMKQEFKKQFIATFPFLTWEDTEWSFEKAVNADNVSVVANALKVNTNVTSLDLKQCKINAQGVALIASVLRTNSSIKTLQLENVCADVLGAEAIANMLKVNTAVTQLFFNKNRIGCDGACAIGDALQHNTTLQRLGLAQNGIGDRGADSIRQSVSTNQSIFVSLASNDLSREMKVLFQESCPNSFV